MGKTYGSCSQAWGSARSPGSLAQTGTWGSPLQRVRAGGLG